MQLGMQSQHKQQKKKEIPQDNSKKVHPKKEPIPSKKVHLKKEPKPRTKKRKSKKSAEEAKDRLSYIVEAQPDKISPAVAVTASDMMSIQGLISLLLTIILCITLSYLAVTFGADKLTMHWMGV